VEQPAVDHDARPDPGGGLDVREVRTLATGAPGQLGQRAQVGVILDLDRNAQTLLHLAPDA